MHYLLKKIDYELWAYTQLAVSLGKAQSPESRSIELFAHSIAVWEVWYERLETPEFTTSLWSHESIQESLQKLGVYIAKWKVW